MQAEMYARGRDVKFVTQQANSPDLNTPDFALFRAIVAVQEGCCKLQWVDHARKGGIQQAIPKHVHKSLDNSPDGHEQDSPWWQQQHV